MMEIPTQSCISVLSHHKQKTNWTCALSIDVTFLSKNKLSSARQASEQSKARESPLNPTENYVPLSNFSLKIIANSKKR
jgi:hypothetical protein